MKRFTILTLTVLLFTGAALAGPVVPKDIDAGAKWFGHVDLAAIRALPLVADLKDKCPQHEACAAKMQEAARKIGLDSLADVQGITLYANEFGGNIGVALFYATKLDQQKMIGLLKEKQPDHKTLDYGGRTLYSWTVGHEGHKKDLAGAFASATLLVIGSNFAQVQAALDVLDGKKPGLANDAPLLQGLPDNVLFASRAIAVPADYRKTTHCPVLRNCQTATAAWSAADGQITGTYTLATDTPEAANNFKAIVDGFKALGVLRYPDLPAVKKILDAAKTEVNGATFKASFNATSVDIEAAVQAVMEQRKAATAPATK